MSIVISFLIFLIFALFLKDFFENRRRRELLLKIPTPKSFPFLNHAGYFIRKLPEDILKLLTKFTNELGSVWYFSIPGSTQIVVSDPKVAEFILSSQKVINKSTEYNLLIDWLGTGLLISGGKKWHSRRKIITPAFHFKILEQFVDVMERQSHILVQKLKKFQEKEVDVFPLVSLYALDVICESAMGYQLKAQTDTESEYVKSVKEITQIIFMRFFDVFLHSPFFYRFSKTYQLEKRVIKSMNAFTNAVIEERKNYIKSSNFNDHDNQNFDDLGGKKKYAFLDLLLQAKVDGQPIDDEGILEEVNTFMFEGHDTTTSAISFSLLNIAKYPKVQKQIYEECCEVFKEKDVITMQDLNQLNYLDKVIKESLRLYPSVPLFARTMTEETNVGDYTFPENVTVTIAPLFMGRDPNIFPNPLHFDPLRFENEHKNPFSYIPFSAGARNCIGQKFAVLEMKSVLSNIVKNFEVSVRKENENPTLISELVLRSKEGVILNFKARN